jgi:hypothetical protein
MLVAAAALLQVAARGAVVAFGLRRAVALASHVDRLFNRRAAAPGPKGPGLHTKDTWEVLRWSLAASAARVSGTCLTQALAARVLLGWYGVPSRLVVGVRPRLRSSALSPSFGGQARHPEFHAWIEGGEICVPAAAGPAYAPLISWS